MGTTQLLKHSVDIINLTSKFIASARIKKENTVYSNADALISHSRTHTYTHKGVSPTAACIHDLARGNEYAAYILTNGSKDKRIHTRIMLAKAQEELYLWQEFLVSKGLQSPIIVESN